MIAQQASPNVIHALACRRVVDGNTVYYGGVSTSAGYILVANSNPQGFYAGMRQVSGSTFGTFWAYKNGVVVGSLATGGAANTALFYLFSGNSHNLAFCYLSKNQTVSGLPFTTVMQAAFYAIVQQFQTWCGRKV